MFGTMYRVDGVKKTVCKLLIKINLKLYHKMFILFLIVFFILLTLLIYGTRWVANPVITKGKLIYYLNILQ